MQKKMMQKKVFLENWKFYQAAILFIIPICLQALVETVLGLMNTFMVGQFGDEGTVAGVASSTSIYDMVWFIFFAVVATGNIFLAQYAGVNDHKKIKETTNIKLFYVLIISIIFVLFSQLFSRQIGQLILSSDGGADVKQHDTAINVAETYNRLISWNYPLLGFAYIMSITMNAVGNVKTPLLVSFGSLILNTVLACVLSLPYQGLPQLGVTGLGIALIASRAVECLIFIIYLVIKRPDYAPNLNIFRFSKQLHWMYFKAFVPMFVNQALFAFSLIIQTVIFAYFKGITVVAAVNIVGTVMAIFYSTFRGYTALTSYFVGENLGRGELELAKENSKKILHLCLGISFIFGIVILTSAFWVPGVLFKHFEPETIKLAVWYLAFNAITYFFINMLQPLFSFLYAGGYTLIVSIVDLVVVWLFDIFITYALLQWTTLSVENIMMIACLTKVLDFIAAYVMYKVVPWNRKLINTKKVRQPLPIIE